MALKFLEIFSRTDSKSRMMIVVLTVGGVIGLIWAASHFLGGGGGAIGNAHVANAPSDLQSVPGGQLTPEYSRALAQQNAQAAQKAQSTGGSAVATLVNTDETAPNPGANCTIVCPGSETADVTGDINNLVKSGKLSQTEANNLLDMAKNNVSVADYSAQLDDLVKSGKITPAQARKMLDTYTKQHANAEVASSSQAMDSLIKSGKMPLDTANQLLNIQKQNATPAQYADALNRAVAEGKISTDTAAQLLAQYTQQKGQEQTQQNLSNLQQMAKSGQISQDAANDLAKLQTRGASVTQYEGELNKLVAEGKMTPATAARLLDQYRSTHVGAGSSEMLKSLSQSGDEAAAAGLNDMVASGKIDAATADILSNLQTQHASPMAYQKQLDALVASGKISRADADKLMSDYAASESANLGGLVASGKISASTADALADLNKRKLSPAEYQKQLNEMVKEGKLPPEIAKSLMMRYQSTAGQRATAQRLLSLQENNASPEEYSAELHRAVKAGVISSEMAAQLGQQYRANTAVVAITPPGGVTPGGENNLTSGSDFDKLQQRLREHQAEQAAQAAQAPAAATLQAPSAVADNSQQFADAAAQAAAQAAAAAEQQRNQRIQQLSNAMSGQAHSLITAWQPIAMVHKGNSAPVEEKDENGNGKTTTTTTTTGTTGTTAPVIKAGTILFAILDTAVNSDYPDTPVMATIVAGPYKGARVLGKVAISNSSTVSQQDRVSLTFNTMDTDAWTTTQSITAFAIDPQTARTVIASNVDYHYFKRYGSMMASAFLSGYASAISNAGATTSTGIFGTTTTHPELSPASKLAVGFGQVGTTLGTATANYINTPPTVKVNAGVALGILFMSDVTVTATGAAAAYATGVPGGGGSSLGRGAAGGAAPATAAKAPAAATGGATSPLLPAAASTASAPQAAGTLKLS